MSTFTEILRSKLKAQTLIGVGTIILGVAAVSAPFFTGMMFSMIMAIAMCALGVSVFVWLFKEPKMSTKIWFGILATLLIISSFFMYATPGLTLVVATWMLITYFIVEGAYALFFSIKNRKEKGAGWAMFYSVISIACGIMLAMGWPLSGMYAIGTYVGAKLMFMGFSVLTLTSAEDVLIDDINKKVKEAQQEIAAEEQALVNQQLEPTKA